MRQFLKMATGHGMPKKGKCIVVRRRKPPAIKVRHWYGKGRYQTETVRLPKIATKDTKNWQREIQVTFGSTEDFPDSPMETNDDNFFTSQEPTRYRKSMVKLHQSWRDIEDKLVAAYIDGCNPVHTCIICKKYQEEVVLCRDCSYQAVFCEDCYENQHKSIMCHAPMKWCPKMAMYSALFVDNMDSPYGQPNHKCLSNRRTDPITVVDIQGRHHVRYVTFCDCEEAAATLVKIGLWPASPKSPNVAFTIQCMEMCRVLMMECQVSLSGFARVLNLIGQTTSNIRVNVYKSLSRECFEEYRHFSYKIRYCQTEVDNSAHDDGTKCPVCPQDGETKMFSLDGNFGLVRKKSAGVSDFPPKHNRFFLNQHDVDLHVQQYDEVTTKNTDCSDFQAGNLVRSKGRTAKLDEKGVFGSVCRHEFPQIFLNLKHGERLGYVVKLLTELVSGAVEKTNIFYDIACVLNSHLKNRNSVLLDRINLAIPVFHAYGHKMACQVLYNPRKVSSFGLTDGEAMERLWSYLRRFSRITKEMTPSHRHDLIVDALIHYGERLKSNLGTSLCTKLKKAEETMAKYEVELRKICQLLSGNVTKDTVKDWSCQLKEHYSTRQKPKQGNICKNEGLLTEIRKVAVERVYLLSLKKNYSDGQTTATRIAKQITKSSNLITKMTKRYNSLEATTDYPNQLLESDAYDPKSHFWNCLDQLHVPIHISNEIPLHCRMEAIDAFHYLERANEEVVMVKEEMRQLVKHHAKEQNIAFIVSSRYVTEGSPGAASLWRKKAYCHEVLARKFSELFKANFVDKLAVPNDIYSLILRQEDPGNAPFDIEEEENSSYDDSSSNEDESDYEEQ